MHGSAGKLALGTVQFGMNYGVGNSRGMVPYDEIVTILAHCQKEGIHFLDTSRCYGESESNLGRAIADLDAHSFFTLCSKMDFVGDFDYANMSRSELRKRMELSLYGSLEALQCESLPYYLLHSFAYLAYRDGYVWDVMREFKEKGLVQNIGISIASTPAEALAAIELPDLTMIQIPFNVFDTRWIVEGVLDRCKAKALTVINRSTFLQGLLLMEPSKAVERVPASDGYMQKLHAIAQKHSIPLKELVFSYVLHEERITYSLIGVDSLDQLEENIALSECPSLDASIVRELHQAFASVPYALVNPSKW